mmetsp:Transcript_15275/g.43293  ORF Transcript_15275/g.43293 Transcript_15275/m.43293 type:complete len:240 (+) Transcript_15275:254-973(+)
MRAGQRQRTRGPSPPKIIGTTALRHVRRQELVRGFRRGPQCDAGGDKARILAGGQEGPPRHQPFSHGDRALPSACRGIPGVEQSGQQGQLRPAATGSCIWRLQRHRRRSPKRRLRVPAAAAAAGGTASGSDGALPSCARGDGHRGLAGILGDIAERGLGGGYPSAGGRLATREELRLEAQGFRRFGDLAGRSRLALPGAHFCILPHHWPYSLVPPPRSTLCRNGGEVRLVQVAASYPEG